MAVWLDARKSSADGSLLTSKPLALNTRPRATHSSASSSTTAMHVRGVMTARAYDDIDHGVNWPFVLDPGGSHRTYRHPNRLDPKVARDAYEIGDGIRLELLHDAVTMGFDGPLRCPEIERHLLVQLPANQMREHFALAGREAFVACQDLALAGPDLSLACVPGDGLSDRSQQDVARNTGFVGMDGTP